MPAKEISIDSSPKCEIVENIGQAWCLCHYEWGLADKIIIDSSQGALILCAVGKVIGGENAGELRYEALTKCGIHGYF